MRPTDSRDIEEALLGSLLIRPELVAALPIRSSDFRLHHHRWIFEAMQSLAGSDLDLLTLSQALDDRGQLAEIGGPAYLSQLLYAAPSSVYAEVYAERLVELSGRREFIETLNTAAGGNADLPDLIADTISRLSSIASGRQTRKAAPILEWHLTARAEIDYRRDAASSTPFALVSRFVDLDTLIGPAYPDDGTLILLTGEPGTGKTILLSDWATSWASQSPGALYSSEMSGFRLMLRQYSSRTGEKVSAMKKGQVETDLAALDDYYGRLPLFVSDGAWNTQTLRADLQRLKHEHGIRWYAFDYMALLQDTVAGEEHERLREMSRRLMAINRELKLAAIIVHTLNQAGEVSGSAGIRYDADTILRLQQQSGAFQLKGFYRPVDVKLLKNRDAEALAGSTVTLGLRSDRPQFVTITPDNGKEEQAPWYNK